jgi:hypothetical protein
MFSRVGRRLVPSVVLRHALIWHQFEIMNPLVKANNKVKCVFWKEKDSISSYFWYVLGCGNTQEIYQTRHRGKGAIFKRDLLHQIPYLVV